MTSPARRATYRVQLRSEFGFAQLAEVAPYLAELGISHVYCSPVFQAAAGSAHGYDVVDPTRVSDDLGGNSGFELLTATLAAHQLLLVLDVVPNHMSIADPRNRWWWDVLSVGRASPFAGYFDINWDHPRLRGRVMAPLLGDDLEVVLERGELQLVVDDGVVAAYFEARLPLSPKTLAELLSSSPAAELAAAIRDAEFVEDRWHYTAGLARLLEEPAAAAAVGSVLSRCNSDPDELRHLLEAQHYALTFWKEATAVMNYRRFFDISTLVGVRVEDPAVLDATHTLVDTLVDSSTVDGLRIDHVDGLRSPGAYLERMRRRHPESWLVVEKILEPSEALPAAWPVDGTTGYEFAARVGGLFVDPAGWEELRQAWSETTGHSDDFATIARDGKLQVMETTLRPNVDRLLRLAAAICRERGLDELAADVGRLDNGVSEYLLGLDVYRTYLDGDAPPEPRDRERIVAALERATAAGADQQTLGLLASLLLERRSSSLEQEFVHRLQQVSSVIMAKGVEDTAFYRFPLLSAVCEVGSWPGHPVCDVEQFHAANAEVQANHPRTLVATSTHDSKRSEDVRARLLLLSELAEPWQAMTSRWRDRHRDRHRAGVPGRTMEELLYQTIVGAWPIDADRAVAYMLKAAHEAKQRTSWIEVDTDYDAALSEFVRELLDDPAFVAEVEAFGEPLVVPERVTSLAMCLLRLTSPGVPDTYQGTELWNLSLVDPDNRRPVDYGLRRRLLGEIDGRSGAAVWSDADSGLPKLFLIRAALDLRRRRPELFDERGDYQAVRIRGRAQDHVVAFSRGAPAGALTVAPRLVVGLGGDWGDTTLELPNGRWSNLLDGADHAGRIDIATLFSRFPVALLERL